MVPAAVSQQDFDRALGDALKCCEAPSTTLKANPSNAAVSSDDARSLAKDLATLMHSHCTKLSLAARPPQTKEAVDASMLDLYKLLPIFASLCQSLNADTMGAALCSVIKNQSRYALIGLRSMVQAVRTDAVNERLSKTGILWESCLELQKVATVDILMSRKVRECSQMVNDAIEDLQSWMNGEEDDNFEEFDDTDSDPSSEAATDSAAPVASKKDEAEITRRISMLSRIVLLLKAIDKRQVCPEAKITMLNAIYSNSSQLTVEVDDLAGEIQESSDVTFIMEMEKAVVHRVEELLTITVVKNEDSKWQEWVKNFRKRWLEEAKAEVQP